MKYDVPNKELHVMRHVTLSDTKHHSIRTHNEYSAEKFLYIALLVEGPYYMMIKGFFYKLD